MTTHDPTDAAEAADGETGKGLRAQLEASLSEVKTLKADARDRAFVDAGLDTSKGMGKAIAQVYDGDVSRDAILEFARTEYDYTPDDPNAAQPYPQAEQVALGQAQLDQVGNVSHSLTQSTRPERLAKARRAGDFESEGAIMGAQMQSMMDAQARPQQ
ncbi:MAG: hypothetical protein DRH08_01250 [Deltaproteobacteria bacterium]|nr:MAG: hypothetical protein DRH08_01250 [Deltaproteobacteria bacterium]